VSEGQSSTRGDFAPCPLCKQYSHSIGEDRLTDAFKHFQSMYAHPVRGHPMGNNFDEKTRDAAQVLMASARTVSPSPEQSGELVARLREDADRQDDNEESIVSTNCMRNAADALESAQAEIDELKHDLERQMTIANIECNNAVAAQAEIARLTAALEGLVRAVNTNELAAAMACHSVVSFANVEDALKPALAALK
jgi:hypothetical protein